MSMTISQMETMLKEADTPIGLPVAEVNLQILLRNFGSRRALLWNEEHGLVQVARNTAFGLDRMAKRMSVEYYPVSDTESARYNALAAHGVVNNETCGYGNLASPAIAQGEQYDNTYLVGVRAPLTIKDAKARARHYFPIRGPLVQPLTEAFIFQIKKDYEASSIFFEVPGVISEVEVRGISSLNTLENLGVRGSSYTYSLAIDCLSDLEKVEILRIGTGPTPPVYRGNSFEETVVVGVGTYRNINFKNIHTPQAQGPTGN